jgi:hypothetical protein
LDRGCRSGGKARVDHANRALDERNLGASSRERLEEALDLATSSGRLARVDDPIRRV